MSSITPLMLLQKRFPQMLTLSNQLWPLIRLLQMLKTYSSLLGGMTV